jgi:hypothetical protein
MFRWTFLFSKAAVYRIVEAENTNPEVRQH